jgi:hypothetical protein
MPSADLTVLKNFPYIHTEHKNSDLLSIQQFLHLFGSFRKDVVIFTVFHANTDTSADMTPGIFFNEILINGKLECDVLPLKQALFNIIQLKTGLYPDW